MNRRLAVRLLSTALLAAIPFAGPAAAKDADPTDRTIVAGKRVGAIRAGMQPADIARIYGRENVKRSRIHVGEGEYVSGLTVLPDTRDRITLQWTQDGKRIEYVRIETAGTAWRTAEGITIGTSAAELTRINGRPFVLTGFGWDYAGRTIGWRGGRLKPYDGRVILEMTPTRKVTAAEERRVLGDGKFASNHPVMRKKRLVVRSMLIRLAGDK